MASVQYLFSYARTFTHELTTAQVHLHKATAFRVPNVLIIQKSWRGYYQRKKYMHIRDSIITIQAYYRGWQVRKNKKHFEEQHKHDMGDMSKKRAALKIQAWWRGIQARKYLRFKGILAGDRIKERARVLEANEAMATKLRTIFAENEREVKEKEEAQCQREALFILYKSHHLLRTYTREGIYSCHGRHKLSTIESLMQALPCQEYMDNVHELYTQMNTVKRYSEEAKNRKMNWKVRELHEALSKSQEHKPKSQVVFEETYNDKPFNLSTKICRKPYIPSVITNDVRPKKSKKWQLLQREKEFELTTRMDLRNRDEPYYIDYWEKEVLGRDRKNNFSTC